MGEHVMLRAADGNEFKAYVARPEGEPIAGLIVVQEIFGVNAHIRSVADGWAEEGFLAVAPAMFDRFERDVELGYDAAGWEKARSFIPSLNPEVCLHDVAAVVDYAASETGKKVGVVGYCFGGSMAYLAAVRLPIAAAVGYYGGNIAQLLGEELKAPVMLHFGKLDEHIPAASVEKIAEAHPEIQIFWYEAGHAFNRDVDPQAYVPDAAELARERTLEFLRVNLS